MAGRILILESDPQRRSELGDELASQGHAVVRSDALGDSLRSGRCALDTLDREAARRPWVAASSAMIELLEAIESAAGCNDPVLLEGEPGTGRESLARLIHAQSGRHRSPFAAASCQGVAHADQTAWLLGPGHPTPDAGLGAEAHAARSESAGLLEAARGGTLWLDGVDALCASLQERIRALLEEGRVRLRGAEKATPIDVRVVATMRGAGPAAERAPFDPVLATRLGAIRLRVPPLRERREDLPLLVDHLLARTCAELGRPPLTPGRDALDRLVAYPWPGNLRELESALLLASLNARGDTLESDDLPEAIASGGEVPGDDSLALRPARKAFEAAWIRRALRATGENRTRAAKLLEISHRALLYKLKEMEPRDDD